MAISPEAVFVEAWDAREGVMAGIVIVAREIPMLAEQPPRGHGGTAGSLQEFRLGEYFPTFEGAEDDLELKQGGAHGSVQ